MILPPLLLDRLACPRDRGGLDATSAERLRCVECGADYAVLDGIPSFITPGDLTPEQRQEQRSRDESAASYEEDFTEALNALELGAVLRWFRAAPGSSCLEVGCATGRVTRELRRSGLQPVGLDFALETLREHRKHDAEALLVHADCTRLPFRDASFAAAVSVQVFEHVPSPVLRETAFSELGRVVAADGPMVITVYYYSLLKRMLDLLTRGRRGRREGFHEGRTGDAPTRIYYHSFTAAELRRLAHRHMRIERLYGYQTLGLQRFRINAGYEVIAQRTPLGLLTSHLAAVVGRRR